MTRVILAGFDPAAADSSPVRFAVAAARFTGAPLVVASVSAEPAVVEGYPHPDLEELVGDVAPAQERLAGELDADDVSIEWRDLAGTSAPRALHEAAEREEAGMLVVGSTGRGALGRVLPGSTAERLMHGAPCAIAVVPHGWQGGGGLRTIGVAYVDTEEGREALRAGHALARRAGATLRVLAVAKVPAAARAETEAPRPGLRGKDFEHVEGEHRVHTEAAVREVVDRLEGDVDVQVDAFLEDPAETLVQVSHHLDLLVCGSRGYGPMRAVLLGGVSRRVTAEAHCPVIVLARGVSAPLDDLAGA